jgi:hypothetical protein
MLKDKFSHVSHYYWKPVILSLSKDVTTAFMVRQTHHDLQFKISLIPVPPRNINYKAQRRKAGRMTDVAARHI